MQRRHGRGTRDRQRRADGREVLLATALLALSGGCFPTPALDAGSDSGATVHGDAGDPADAGDAVDGGVGDGGAAEADAGASDDGGSLPVGADAGAADAGGMGASDAGANDGGAPDDGGANDDAGADGGDADAGSPSPGGALDPSFGSGGIAYVGEKGVNRFFDSLFVDDETGAITAIGAEIWLNGNLIVARRLHGDGTLDMSFGVGGLRGVPGPGTYLDLRRVHKDGDGFVAGALIDLEGVRSLGVVRLDADVGLVSSFGNQGAALAPVPMGNLDPGDVVFTGAALLACGTSRTGPYTGGLHFARFDPITGALDTAFGEQGLLTYAPGGSNLACSGGLALDAGGRVRFGGDLGVFVPVLGRIDPSTGAIADGYPSTDPAPGLVNLANGYTVVEHVNDPSGGTLAVTSNFNQAFVVRVDASGAIDPAYASGGVFAFTGDYTGIAGAALDEQGRLLLAGEQPSPTNPDQYEPFVLRLLPDGAPDPLFGDAGFARISPLPFGVTTLYPSALALDADGRILVAGVAFHAEGVPSEDVVIRFLP